MQDLETERDIIKEELEHLSPVINTSARHMEPLNEIHGFIDVAAKRAPNINAYADILGGFVSIVNCRIAIGGEIKTESKNTQYNAPPVSRYDQPVYRYEFVHKKE
jgi:hypothetical protein